MPPFHSLLARRAVNYALDRARLAALSPGVAQPACGIFPPNFPGWVPYCPYTVHPGRSGRWTGPDLTRARELVLTSCTRGQRLILWAQAKDDLRFARELAATLTAIGYRASVRIRPGSPLAVYGFLNDPRSKLPIVRVGWAADYPLASNFFNPLLTCTAYDPHSYSSFNLSGYCDHAVDRLAGRATALESTDPAAADALWAVVQRRVMDAAAVAPYATENSAAFVSARVGNYQDHPELTTLYDQLWVR